MKKTYKTIKAFVVLLSLMTFNLSAQLSGTVTINAASPTSGTNYQTFSALASALATNGISGPLTVDVVANSGPYIEQVTFDQIVGMSATNTITINGNNNLLTFGSTNSGAPHTLRLNGTDYMYINNLQMSGTGSTYAMVCILYNSANYNNFSACTFSCPANGTSSYQIPWAISSTGTSPSSDGMADNNTMKGCQFFSGYYALFLYGLSSAPYTQGNSFIDCHIQDWYYYCIYSYYAKNLTFKGCLFDRPTRTTLTTQYFCYGWYMQGFLFDGNTVTNLYAANPGYTGTFYGFYYAGYYNQDVSNPCIWRNNLFKSTRTAGTSYWFMYNYYGANEYYHNTFSFDAQTGGNATHYVFYYCYDYNGYLNKWWNNNFSCTTNGTGTKYMHYLTSSYPVPTMNYNNYYMTSANSYVGYYTSAATNLAAWQSQNMDANSFALDPQYVNWANNDLHPTNTSLNNQGTPKNLPLDITNAPRSQTTPDIGAFEFLSNNCASVPTASTITSPTYALCPGENANLILNGFTSDLGIVYQWLTSTTSSVGPWTPIAGANTVLYNTPGINQTTYYGIAMTCTNTVGSNTAVTVVNVAGTTTNSVPYYESFEGIGKPNKLPNCSWYSPQLGATAVTYTSSNTLGRTPRTGSKFATFIYNPTGAKHVYTNGIQLNAGVTYSASVWYQTEYYGYNNWTDLSILYGTTQTTTGLVSICSTNGPAVANVYKSLSGTFTVPTSGLYYVAIRATSASGSCQYLSWDDLAIEIPCSVNAPTMNVSANTTSICAGEQVVLTATGADTYTWMPSGNTGNSSTEMPTNTGNIYVIGSNLASGCTTTLSQMIYVNPSPNVLAYAATASVCSGSPANLTAFGAISYTWSTGANNSNITVNPTSASSYTVLGENAYGCVGSAVVSLGVNPLPTVNVSSSAPNEMCIGETQVLTATGGISYSWVASPSGIIMQGASVSISPNATTSYVVTGTDANGCTNTANITQNVSECVGINKLNASANGVKIYPNPTSGEFSIEVSNSSVNTIEVTDVTGRVITTATASNEIVNVNLSNLANGVYYVKIQSEIGTEVVKVVKH